MTDDLVKRARDAHQDSSERTYKIPLIIEMADRIEALTAEHNATLARLAGAVAREIALLAEREELVECNEQFSVDNQFLKKRAEAAEADNARLREAVAPLIVIALDNLDGMDAETREECERDIAKARAAINTGKEPSHE